jgi:prepilin-type N-terminal cleavage/methylation domain-containing protein
MPANRCPRGFTLVEMMISMALMALVMVAAAVALRAAESAHSYNAEKAELVARSRGVLDRIALDVRKATSATIKEDGALAVTVTNGWIHTYAWDGTPGGNVTYTETDPGTITFAEPWGVPGTPVVLTGYVHTLQFEQVGDGCSVRIALRGQHATCEAAITSTPVKSLY